MTTGASRISDLNLHADSPAWCAIDKLAVEGCVSGQRLMEIVEAFGCPVTTFIGVSGPYLDRWDLGDKSDHGHRYLHRFRRGDEDRVLHDHPWWFSATILLGGYVEERFVNGQTIRRRHVPGDGFGVPLGMYHRVDELLGAESWSLIETGPKGASWGFWDPISDKRWPWREYLDNKRLYLPNDRSGVEAIR